MEEEIIASELSFGQKKTLLKVARQTITAFCRDQKIPRFDFPDSVFQQKCGAFVTLTKKGSLRGCIGYVVGYKPLIETIVEMAVAAASRDPRFSPVQLKELEELEIEISVLSPLKPIKNIEQIEIGTHGIMLEKGYHSGLLLPQVALEYGWNREQFLRQTCLKAGLTENSWQDPQTTIQIFSATVFCEKEFAG